MRAFTTSPGQGNTPFAFKDGTDQVEHAIWERPVLTAYRHILRAASERQIPLLHEHSSKLTQYSQVYDWFKSQIEPQIKFVSVVHPNSTQLSSSTESQGIAKGEVSGTFRQQREGPRVVDIVLATYPDYTQLSSSMEGWHVAVVESSEETLPQQWSDWELEEDLAAIVLDTTLQLEDMKELEDGWADGMQPAAKWGEGFGLAPSPMGLDWLAAQFYAHYAYNLPQPYLYPTPEGGVQAEWSLGTNEVSLEINLENHKAEWHCLDLQTWQDSEHVLTLDDEAAWGWLVQELHRLGLESE